MNILEERKAQFSMDKFMSMPRCTGAWTDESGAGCLLTAFWYGFGIDLIWGDYLHKDLIDATNDWADESGFTFNDFLCGGLCGKIVLLNDHSQEVEAFALLLSFMRHVGLINENAEYEPVLSCKQ